MTRIDELRAGDQMFSPAGRWETITAFEDTPAVLIRIRTDRTGDYAWLLSGSLEVLALTPANLRATTRTVAVEETKSGIVAVLSSPSYTSYCWDDGSLTLAMAQQKRGEGWEFTDWPGGGELVVTTLPSKAAARSAIVRAARAHARGLGVKYRGRVGGVS
jgi:hypothetical protein